MVATKAAVWAEVDEQGRVILPPEIAASYGVQPGVRIRLDAEGNHVRLHRPATHLNKLYIEPTNRCNIDCSFCMRGSWNVSLGQMQESIFARILDGLSQLDPLPTVFFGGIGEPLAHPKTIDMIRRVKMLGAPVEMITNGTLLDEKRSRRLIEAGLDVLWVSIDGATPESYADVRLGAHLPKVLENLATFRRVRPPSHHPTPEIGVAFVAMKRNIADLPEVVAMGRRHGATRFMVSNVLPYAPEMCEQTLYDRTLTDIAFLPSPWLPRLSLPKMELTGIAGETFLRLLNSSVNITFAGNNLGGANNVCTFVESGTMAIGWDGGVSPCPPLLHTHVGYLRGRRRVSYQHVLGNVQERDMLYIWNDPDYVQYRERVQGFAFAPCTSCGECDLAETNETDCFDSVAPACGGCLWAQGVIQCP